MKKPKQRHFFEPRQAEYILCKELQKRLQAASANETVRRALITLRSLLDVQDSGGQIVLMKQGQPDKVIWLL